MRYHIQLPDNKSIRIREMIWSWIRGGEVLPVSPADCRDICITHRAISVIRATVEACQDTTSESPVVIDVEDCGAAYRFLMPVLSATSATWLLTGTPRLLKRPILPLVEVLREIGADIERVRDGWLIHGKSLSPVETRFIASLQIDATQSSQLASALVLSAPLLNLKTLRLTTTDIPSLSYLRMTLALTRDWPVTIPGVEPPGIPVGAHGDWSAALFWFAHARLHPENEYVLSPLSLDSIQGDSIIAQWFREMNATVSSVGTRTPVPTVEIKTKPLETTPEMVFDMRDNLDTVPVMAALACLLPADFTFLNIRNLRYKESDRAHALVTQLQPYADIELSDNELHVVGKKCPADARPVFDTHNDHRMAMAFLLFGPNATLNDTECLTKSYPGLLQDLTSL